VNRDRAAESIVIDRGSYRRDAGLLAVAMALILAICFAPFLFGDASLMESAREGQSIYMDGAVAGQQTHGMRPADNASAFQTEPWLAIEHRLLLVEHRLPLWDPYDGYGTPFAAAMQPQPFYPLTTLLALRPSPRAYSYWIVARLFLCGWFAALFIRLFADRWAALGAGVACSLTGYFLNYINMPDLSVEVVLPMLLWSTELLSRRVSGVRVAALGAAAGLAYLGGMPEATFLVLAITAAYSVVRLATMSSGRMTTLGALIAAQALGAALGAIQLLPFVQYVALSFNIHDAKEAVGLSVDPGWFHGALLELVPRAFGSAVESTLTPAGGYTGLRGFVGASAAILAIVAIIAAIRTGSAGCRSVVLLLTAVAAYAFLKRFGSPLVDWTGDLPLLRSVYLAKYLEPVLGISVGLLVGFGIAAIRTGRIKAVDVAIAFGVILFLLNWLYLGSVFETRPEAYGLYSGAFQVALAAGAITALAAGYATSSTGVWRFAASTVLVLGLGAEPLIGYLAPTYWNSSDPLSANPYRGAPYITYLHGKLANSRARVLGSGALYPNWAGAYGISDPRSLNALYPSSYLPMVDAFIGTNEGANRVNGYDRFVAANVDHLTSDLGRRWLALSSIEYLVADPAFSDGITHAARHVFTPVYESPGVRIYKVPDPLPRLGLVHAVQPAKSFEAALAILTSPHFDIRRDAVITGIAPLVDLPNGPESVTITNVRSDRLTAEVHASSAALLLQNDTWFPGWIATVDGTTVPILQADAIFRGIAIPAGRHSVEIAYRPRSAYIGAAISLVALCICGGFVIARSFRTRRLGPKVSP
jgi:hypothetical protein